MITTTAPLAALLESCRVAGFASDAPDTVSLAPAVALRVTRARWAETAAAAREAGFRWCALWAQESAGTLETMSCLEAGGEYLVLRTRNVREDPVPSIAGIYSAASRPERHATDLLGVRFSDQPDNRRWTRHMAWTETEYPLGGDYADSQAHGAIPPDSDYPFVAAHGPGVVEIPVGPVHAGIIEPGHFRFQAVGETVLNLEERLGYVHKGIERIAVGRDAAGLARLAGRVSGDCTVGHAWAACQAMERAAGVDVPARALALRAVLAERERVANHLGDIGAICNDVGFGFGQYQLTRLKEAWLRECHAAFGHRLMMDCVVPGGVAANLAPGAETALATSARALAGEFASLVRILEASESLEDRLMATGRLAPEMAAMLGTPGFVGRAAGQSFDVRRNAPYAPYDALTVTVPTYRAGDVAARAKVRADEVGVSLDLIARLLDSLPPGPHRVDWPRVEHACEGIGLIEGWRGEIVTYVAFAEHGRIARFFPRDPSWLTWPALELMVQGNIVPDFPVCNKSVNGSYSGHDL